MKRTIFFIIALAAALSCVNAFAQGLDKGKEAVVPAEKWLALVDEGQYADSWRQAARFFKSNVKQDQWEQSVQAARQPLGKLISRKLSSKVYTKTLPGAPDGEYVVMQFETSFQDKKSALETITCAKEKDGSWRVAGYYIK
jgi:hypothetical protein